MFLQTVTFMMEVLITLTRIDPAEEEYDPYDGVEHPPGRLDPTAGEKGLGMAGCVPVPRDIWDKHAPVSLDWALRVLPDQGHSHDPGLHALAGRMARDGMLGVKLDPCRSQFRAFANSKNATKGALIADLRELNSLLPKPLPFKLPSLGQLDSLFSLCKALKLKLQKAECRPGGHGVAGVGRLTSGGGGGGAVQGRGWDPRRPPNIRLWISLSLQGGEGTTNIKPLFMQ